MWQKIGNLAQQKAGFKAFIPTSFPQNESLILSPELQAKHGEAMRMLGKLDGISQLLPDVNFYLLMFVRKEAASSSQIEGTQASMINAIEAEVSSTSFQVKDVDDIICYIRALNYGMDRLKTIPLSVRLIKEIHQELMNRGRATQHPFPGEFRYTQNWIGGTSPSNARFVPPPAEEISRCIGDLEKFIHDKKSLISPLIKAALLHAQFETIHPFTDGNGRTGRLLITLFLWQEKLLTFPLLYLSSFFKKHQDLYYERLQKYHSSESQVDSWLDFFFEGIIFTSNSACEIAYKINQIREQDMMKISKLGKTSSLNALEVLKNLFHQPIVDISKIQEWTKTKTRSGGQKIIDRFINLGILVQRDPKKTYGRTYEYRSYIQAFENSEN
ncbi:MAG: Fic family protein [Parachlamydiales bacterium]|jgi:Fic family protein